MKIMKAILLLVVFTLSSAQVEIEPRQVDPRSTCGKKP